MVTISIVKINTEVEQSHKNTWRYLIFLNHNNIYVFSFKP